MVEISATEKEAMQRRLYDWLLQKNIDWAKGKTRNEIFACFGNELEAIAYIRLEYLQCLGSDVSDSRVYSGMGYFIDHAVNHHPEVPLSDYQKIQEILNVPDDVLLDDSKKGSSLIFVKQYHKLGTVIVSVSKANNGAIVLHKSFFHQRKNSYAKFKSVRASLSLAGGHSAISPAE